MDRIDTHPAVGSQAPSSRPTRKLRRLRTLLGLVRPSERVGSATDYCLQPRDDIFSIGDSYGDVRRPQIEKARPCFFLLGLYLRQDIQAQVKSAAHVSVESYTHAARHDGAEASSKSLAEELARGVRPYLMTKLTIKLSLQPSELSESLKLIKFTFYGVV